LLSVRHDARDGQAHKRLDTIGVPQNREPQLFARDHVFVALAGRFGD
jgi:hypothetical protein